MFGFEALEIVVISLSPVSEVMFMLCVVTDIRAVAITCIVDGVVMC